MDFVYISIGDTDSVMCKFWIPDYIWNYTDTTLLESFKNSQHKLYNKLDEQEKAVNDLRTNVILAYVSCLSTKAASYCSSLCFKPNNLEFEKIMWPFLLLSCKRYIYEKYELGQHAGRGKPINQGVSAKRRDFCLLLQRTFGASRSYVMKTNNANRGEAAAVKHIQNIVQQLYDQAVNIDDLVLSQQLAGRYKNPNQKHVSVARKRVERNPADIVHVGERVQFAMTDAVTEGIRDKSKKSICAKLEIKTWQLAEDPAYMKANNIPYNTMFYIDRQLKNPLTGKY